MRDAFDVIVVGSGAWGSAATQHLSARRVRVLCLDRFEPPHAFGSTHGHSRVLRCSSSRPEEVGPLLARAHELWRSLQRKSSVTLLREVGCVYAGTESDAVVAQVLASYRYDNMAHEVLEGSEAKERFPGLRLRPGELAVFESHAGVLDPEACVTTSLRAASASGAELRFNEPISDWATDGDSVEVVTERGRYHADHLVLAVGPWSPDVARLDLPLVVERQVMLWYADSGSEINCVFVFPTTSDEIVFYGAPEPGKRVKVAFHGGGEVAQADSLRRAITREDVDPIRSYLEHRVPSLVGEPLDARACMYTKTPDSQFAIGRHPDAPRVIVATGESGGGFQLSQVVGELIADLILSERPELPFMSPARFRTSHVTDTTREGVST